VNWARPGDRLHFEFPTHNAAGAYADADALPTATLARQGADDLAVPVVIAHAATGLYHGYADLPTNYTPGDVVHPRVIAIIGGTSKRLMMPTVRLVGLDFGVIGNPATSSIVPLVPVPVPGLTISRKLIFYDPPDAIPTVRVFRNGVRSDTIVLPILDATYNVVYSVPSGWFQTDYVQIIVYATFGGTDVVYELFGDLLGGRLTEDSTITAAVVCDFIPPGLPTATVISDGEGNTPLSPDPAVSAGATAMEFLIQVPVLAVNPGRYLCLVTVPTDQEPVEQILWQLQVYPALTVGTAQFCLPASTTHDRDCNELGRVALRQSISVRTKDDVVFDFTMADSADDVTGWAISFFVATAPGAANLIGFPLTIGSGVTITGTRTFRVEFPTDPIAFALVGNKTATYHWLAKRTDAGFRDDLAAGTLTVRPSEDPPTFPPVVSAVPPTVVSVSVATDGVTWTVTFSKPVRYVAGFGYVISGSEVGGLVYVSGTDSTVLVFTAVGIAHVGDIVSLVCLAGAVTDEDGSPLAAVTMTGANHSLVPSPT